MKRNKINKKRHLNSIFFPSVNSVGTCSQSCVILMLFSNHTSSFKSKVNTFRTNSSSRHHSVPETKPEVFSAVVDVSELYLILSYSLFDFYSLQYCVCFKPICLIAYNIIINHKLKTRRIRRFKLLELY